MIKRMNASFIIATIIILILFIIVVGKVHITFNPFSIHISRLYNVFGWLCLILAGVFWEIDNAKSTKEKVKTEIEKIEKIYNNEISKIHNDTLCNDDKNDVKLNNKTKENGN